MTSHEHLGATEAFGDGPIINGAVQRFQKFRADIINVLGDREKEYKLFEQIKDAFEKEEQEQQTIGEQIELPKIELPDDLSGLIYVQQAEYAEGVTGQEKGIIYTSSLLACKGVVIWDEVKKHGLLAHISSDGNLVIGLNKIFEAFDSDLAEANVYVVQGAMNYPHPSNFVYQGIEGRFLPTVNDIAEIIATKNPKKIYQAKTSTNAVALDLNGGTVSSVERNDNMIKGIKLSDKSKSLYQEGNNG